MRSKKTPAKKIQLDPIFGNQLVAKIINGCMLEGKKSVAAKQIYRAIDIIAEQSGKDGLVFLTEAIENVNRPSKSVPAVSEALPTKFLLLSAPSAVTPWLSVGS